MRVRLLQSFLVVSALSLAGTASAHFKLKAPAPSNAADDTGGKGPKPCGPDTASNVITSVTGGSMIPLTIDETVFHPGHYRVALALKSRDELDPSKPGGLKEPDVMDEDGNVITSGNSFSAVIQNPPVFPVIADNVFPHTDKGGERTTMIAIPNVNCDKCTLQVIEFMAEHGPDYYYRHCADLKITADTTKPIFDPSGMGGGGSGGSGVAGSSAAGSSSSGAGGAPAGGAPGGGAPGASGSAATAGASTGGAGTKPTAPAEDEGGCSVARLPSREGTALSLLTGLLLGLGWFARRRNRPE